MKRCKKCILPESYPGITFNDEGICNFCEGSNPDQDVLGKEKLLEVLNAKPRAGKYDCVVPLSGGKDSSYILYYCVKELGLNPLAVSYNSGYQKRIAEENIKTACEKLGIDAVTVHSPGDIQGRILRENYLVAKKYGTKWWGTCDNCEPVLRTVTRNSAIKYRIPFVMWGSSLLEAADPGKYQQSHTSGSSVSGDSEGMLGRILKTALRDPARLINHFKYYWLCILQRLALKFSLRYALNPFSTPPLAGDNPKFIHFFDYVQWDSIINTRLLVEELGWKHPEGKETRFDCNLHCVNNLNVYQTRGISHDGIGFCNFIRDGRMSREEGLEKERLVVDSLESEYRELLQRLDLEDQTIL